MMIQNIINLVNNYFRGAIPLFITANFILLIILICLNRKELWEFFKKIRKRTWLILILIILLASFFRIFVTSHQTIMFGDEGWYMETAKNILEGNYGYFVQGIYKSIGWPFIIAVGFFLFGVDNLVAHYASSVLGILTVFNVFCLALVLFKKEGIALWSAFLFSLVPVHIAWSGSAETNVASLFFITLALFFSFLYFERKNNHLLWLSLVTLAFACQVRIENYFLLLLFLVGLLIFKIKIFRKTDLKTTLSSLLLIALVIILITPNLANTLHHHLSANWNELTSKNQQYAPNWGISNLVYNSTHQASHFFDSRYHPPIFSVFLIIGFIWALIKKRKASIFLSSWFLLLFLIYFGCWPNLGPKSRFFMGFYPITTIFAGYGLYSVTNSFSLTKIKKFLILVLIPIIILSFFFYIKKEIGNTISDFQGKMQTAITHLAAKKIPQNCIIIANEPGMLTGVIDSEIINLKFFLIDENSKQEIFQKTDCLLFFEDYTCDSNMQFISGWQENCQKIKKEYKLTPFLIYSEKRTLEDERITRENFPLINPLALIAEIFKIERPFYEQRLSKQIESYGFYKIFLKE
jgi:4-amino-4-deoxy-L-arabinose transferase-like glycosyltransferase